MIYFIQDTSSRAIKIGISKHPLKRLSDLQTAHHAALILIGVMEGSQYEEQVLHRKFERLQGEWFEPSRSLLAYIQANAVTPQSMGHVEKEATMMPVQSSNAALIDRLCLFREVAILIATWVMCVVLLILAAYSVMRTMNYGDVPWTTGAMFFVEMMFFSWFAGYQKRSIIKPSQRLERPANGWAK